MRTRGVPTGSITPTTLLRGRACFHHSAQLFPASPDHPWVLPQAPTPNWWRGSATRTTKMRSRNSVRRHGPMVFGVCRRMLPCRQDAEDAFQATFLVLAVKPDAVRPPDRVGAWLHGVACRAALKARRTAARRVARTGRSRVPPAAARSPTSTFLSILDEALLRAAREVPPSGGGVPPRWADAEGGSLTPGVFGGNALRTIGPGAGTARRPTRPARCRVPGGGPRGGVVGATAPGYRAGESWPRPLCPWQT